MDDNQALALRKAGLSYAEMVERGDFATTEEALKAVERALGRIGETDPDRALELARLDAIQRAFWRQMIAGDAVAAKIVLQVMSQRALLQGGGANRDAASPLDQLRAKRNARLNGAASVDPAAS